MRNLWQDVKAQGDEDRRKTIGTAGRALYGFFVLIGGLLALDLYTRPESAMLKIFGVLAVLGLVVSDIFWAWATHYSAAGKQRNVARFFWAAGVAIFALNVIAEYQHYLGSEMSEFVQSWYKWASITTVVEAAIGWALYSLLSPEQAITDVGAKAKSDAIRALLRGVENPTPEAQAQFNGQVEQASAELSGYAASVVSSQVSGMTTRSLNEPAKPVLSLNATGAKVIAKNGQAPN